MVLKTEVCRFSGLKIYPGHGMRLTKMDSQTYLFLSAKCKRLFNLRLRPAKLAWTTQYRKAHKKVRTRRTMWLRRARCALSRDVDVVSRVDARRRTARPLGKSHRSRVLGFFGHSARTGLGRHAGETSRHTPHLPAPIGAAIDARARPCVGTLTTRRPGDVASDPREARKIGFAPGRHEGDATGHRRRLRFAGFPRVNAERLFLFWAVRKKKRATTLNATLTRSNLPS
jgi:large subunit ribosomal protein L24e